MNKKQWLVHLYLFNLALIVIHEIDSAFSIHTIFIRTGHTEFTLPVSLVLLGMVLLVSLLHLFVTLTAQP